MVAFDSVLGIAVGTVAPTYEGLYEGTWEHPGVWQSVAKVMRSTFYDFGSQPYRQDSFNPWDQQPGSPGTQTALPSSVFLIFT